MKQEHKNIEQEHEDRLIKIEIEVKPINLMILQVFMPTMILGSKK